MPGGLELASIEGHSPLGHSEEAGQVGGQPAQAGDTGENEAQRQIVLDGAAIDVLKAIAPSEVTGRQHLPTQA